MFQISFALYLCTERGYGCGEERKNHTSSSNKNSKKRRIPGNETSIIHHEDKKTGWVYWSKTVQIRKRWRGKSDYCWSTAVTTKGRDWKGEEERWHTPCTTNQIWNSVIGSRGDASWWGESFSWHKKKVAAIEKRKKLIDVDGAVTIKLQWTLLDLNVAETVQSCWNTSELSSKLLSMLHKNSSIS